MSVGCEVRRASAADLAAVLRIERGCAEVSHWSEATWRSLLEESARENAARVVLVAETLADVLGFVVVQSAGGNAELEAVAVKAEARRRGVARSLCGQAIAWSRKGNESPGATEMHLEVRAGNAAALSFYQKLGFIEQGRRRGYYRDPEEDAVVMGLVLNGAEDVGNALDAKESAAFGE